MVGNQIPARQSVFTLLILKTQKVTLVIIPENGIPVKNTRGKAPHTTDQPQAHSEDNHYASVKEDEKYLPEHALI